MIRQVSAAEQAKYLQFAATESIFGCVLYSLYQAYHTMDRHIGFWMQEQDGTVTAGLAQIGSLLTVVGSDRTDAAELAAFIDMLDEIAVLQGSEADLRRVLPHLGWRQQTKQVLVCDGMTAQPDDSAALAEEPNVGQVYALLAEQDAQFAKTQERVLWIWDRSYRARHGGAKLYLRKDGNATVSVGYISPRAGMVIDLLTRREQRGHGYAKALVRCATAELTEQHKRAYVLCEPELVGFYTALGYDRYGTASIAFRRETENRI